MSGRSTGLPLILLALLAPSAAPALDRSVDTQLVQPVLLPHSLLGVDSARIPERRAVVGGAAWQLEHMPLQYYENGQSVGAAILARNTLHLAGAMPLSSNTLVGARLSAVLMDPGDQPQVAPEHRLAAGDLDLFTKLAVYQGPSLAVGPRFDLWVPTGTDDSWVSEKAVRYSPALLADASLGPMRLMGQLGMLIRRRTDTDQDFVLGSELTMGLGALVRAGEHWAGLAEISSRHGVENFMRAGAENPVEIKAGGRWLSPGRLGVDVALGSAMDHGYGAADLRLLVAVTRLVPEKRPPPPPQVVDIPPPSSPVIELESVPEQVVVEWDDGELAQVHHGQIVIRDPLQFELATAVLLPESEPILEAVVDVLTAYPQIELLIIEGHASEEGTDRYNYELSNDRAMVVYERLVGGGVRPERLGFRGRGETAPVATGGDEVSLALNRRVEFHIIKVRDYLDVGPQYDTRFITLPWSGESILEPPPGDALLSAEAHPILLEEYVDQPAPAELLPDAGMFREGLHDEVEPEAVAPGDLEEGP